MAYNFRQQNKNLFILVVYFFMPLMGLRFAFAEAPEATKIGIIQQKIEDENKLQEKEKVIKKKVPLEVEDKRPQEAVGQEPTGAVVLIKKFILNGATTFKPEDFVSILAGYKDKSLGINEFNAIATAIQKFYRAQGFITTYVYIPMQKIVNNTVEIRVIEGVIGTIEVEGAKYFDSEDIRKKFNVREGDTVLYNDLLKDIRRLNTNPDLTVKAVLMPGERKDTTDIVLKVKDENPQHIFFDYNNRGTKYTGKQRFGIGYANNDLLGFGDMLTVRFQKSNEKLNGGSVDYNAPVNNAGTRAGVYASYVETELAGEFEVLNAKGKSLAGGVYLVHPLLELENLRANFGTGLDIKQNNNYLLGTETSNDDLSVAKLNLSLSSDDSFGATFLNNEVDFGIPDFAGSLGRDDIKASRLGAGGDFTKYILGFGRRINLPFNSYFSVSGKGQYTSDKLVAGEQFYIGGADTVRGYPELEYMGDCGYFVNTEIRTPIFLLPAKMELRDKIQMVYFFDYGHGNLWEAVVGERKSQSLMSAGWGIRFQPWKNVYFKLDWGFPLHPRASDNSKSTVHLWAHIDAF